MAEKTRNPGLHAGVSQIKTHHHFHLSGTKSSRQGQMLVSRFGVSPWLAYQLARLCFGEGRND